MCVDYWGLNKIMAKDQYPLLYIDDLLDKLHGAHVFTKLNLQEDTTRYMCTQTTATKLLALYQMTSTSTRSFYSGWQIPQQLSCA